VPATDKRGRVRKSCTSIGQHMDHGGEYPRQCFGRKRVHPAILAGPFVVMQSGKGWRGGAVRRPATVCGQFSKCTSITRRSSSSRQSSISHVRGAPVPAGLSFARLRSPCALPPRRDYDVAALGSGKPGDGVALGFVAKRRGARLLLTRTWAMICFIALHERPRDEGRSVAPARADHRPAGGGEGQCVPFEPLNTSAEIAQNPSIGYLCQGAAQGA
jgi:hypothetical protein